MQALLLNALIIIETFYRQQSLQEFFWLGIILLRGEHNAVPAEGPEQSEPEKTEEIKVKQAFTEMSKIYMDC